MKTRTELLAEARSAVTCQEKLCAGLAVEGAKEELAAALLLMVELEGRVHHLEEPNVVEEVKQ